MNLFEFLGLQSRHMPRRIMLERRRAWPRILGWVVALLCWVPIITVWNLMADSQLQLW